VKNTKGSVVLYVAFIILLIGASAFILLFLNRETNPAPEQTALTTNPPSSTPQSTVEPIVQKLSDKNCHESPNYFVVEGGVTDSVGTNLLIKYKTSADQKYSCLYSKESNDFEIKNKWAEYYWGITDHFLILDSGTGPDPRGMLIYDLTKRTQVFNDQYSHPATIGSGTIDYWTPIKTPATKSNCPEFNEYNTAGLGIIIESHVSLNLSTLTKKDLGLTRCSPTQ
jgi:hypothetical protein